MYIYYNNTILFFYSTKLFYYIYNHIDIILNIISHIIIIGIYCTTYMFYIAKINLIPIF